MVADFFSTCLLKGEEGRQNVAGALNSSEGFLPDISVTEELNILKELANKKPDLLQRIKEFIKGLLAKLKGERRFKSLEADLTYLDNYVEKLINSNTTKNTAKSGEVRWSKSTEKIVDLSNDNELNKLIGNSTGSNKYKIISKYILKKIGTKKIILPDNREAIVDKSDADHISHNSGDKKTAQISEVDKIIKNSKLVAYENSTKNNKFSIFYYYKSTVKYGNDTFPVYLNIGVTKNDKTNHLYDITQKLRDTAHRINDVDRLSKSIGLETVSLDNSISNKSENVNENFSEDDSKFNDDTRYSSGLMEQIRSKFLIFPIYYGKSRQANYNT